MGTTDRIQKRFDELAQMAEALVGSKSTKVVSAPSRVQPLGGSLVYENVKRQVVDNPLMIEWETSVLSLLNQVLGETHPTYRAFQKGRDTSSTDFHGRIDFLVATFRSAKSDYEGGYLFDVRKLIHAEVFADELDLAFHYLERDGKTAAAVVAGVVLETTLRKLVADNELAGSSLNQMNESLRKAEIYTQIIWRQVQAWADLRNAAAHGNADQLDAGDVERMIAGIRDFVAKHIT